MENLKLKLEKQYRITLSDKEIMSLMDTNLNVAKSSAKKAMEEVNSLLGI